MPLNASLPELVGTPLPRGFYERGPDVVARELIGKVLVRVWRGRVLAGRVVEAEAYLSHGDSACHAFAGRSARNAAMFGPAGRAYVYAIHSRWCLNAVTEPAGTASAVLIRAIEPLTGFETMERLRRVGACTTAAADRSRPRKPPNWGPPAKNGGAPRDLARGPSRLCEALGIDRRMNGWDLTGSIGVSPARGELCVAEPGGTLGETALDVGVSARIGVTSAHELPLRFYLRGSRYVSGTSRARH